VLALPDGKHLVAVTDKGEIKFTTTASETEATFVVWNLDTQKQVRKLPMPLHVTRLLLLQDQCTVLYGTEVGRLVWWDWREATPQRIVEAHNDGWVHSLELSRDGMRIITAGDRTAKVWDARTGRLLASFEGHTDAVKAACFLDDDHVVSGSRDATIRVWQISNPRQVALFTDAPDERKEIPSYLDDPWEIHCLAASNGTIVAGETSGRVRILQFKNKKLLVRR
jgi:WD40 repeat protein